MIERIETEEEYREMLMQYIRMISDGDEYSIEELVGLIRILEVYENENC